MAKKADELKKEMALPPIPQQPRKDRHGERNRSRVRMEVSLEQAAFFTGVLADKLEQLKKESAEFKNLYTLYWSLKIQIEKVTNGQA